MIEHDENKITLPSDAMPHSNSNIEWWYFFSFLHGDQGSNLAVMGSFFRVGESDCTKGHYFIYRIVDLNSMEHYNYSAIDRKLKRNMIFMYFPFYLLLHPLDTKMWKLYKRMLTGRIPQPHRLVKASVRKNPLTLKSGSNKIIFTGENLDSFDVFLKKQSDEIVLHFEPKKPIALIGKTGKPDDLYYYSYTHNQVKGEIKRNNGKENLYGTGWFDHQWGRDYSLAQGTGWNWFGLQFDDGRELLLNEMRSSKTGETFAPMANIIEKDGNVKLTRNVTFKALNYWKSLQTNARYPIEWEINIPEFNMKLHVKGLFNKQEMQILGPLQAIWEGAVTFTGKENNQMIGGKGFMELVGYSYSAYL